VRDIRSKRASPGAEILQCPHTDAYRSYDCAICGQAGTTTQPTTVTAERGSATLRVTLNHDACAPSRVSYVSADRVPAGIARTTVCPSFSTSTVRRTCLHWSFSNPP
jgi:hypothetical protein